MSERVSEQIKQEADLIGRFADSYRHKISELIERMNRAPDPNTDAASLRVCVEAVDMILSSQSELARILSKITA